MSRRIATVSKFISKYLRHEPESLGLNLEPGGWVFITDLLDGAEKHGFPITKAELFQVVAENDKQRFSLDETESKIRANQGHSTSVDLQLSEAEPPPQLFHGTVSKFLDAILVEGLKKMNRHDVHLSKDMQTASKVGERRGKPVILVIDSAKMAADGYKFRLSENGVWLTDHVPPKYIRLMEDALTDPTPKITEIALKKHYKFMYENFVIATQQGVFLMLEKHGDIVTCLHFDSPQMKYGSPNDEARGGHPLFKFGLGFYGLFEVENSPWIKERMVANRVHPCHFDGMKHYIACFKDVMLEVICLSYEEKQMSLLEIKSLMDKELDNLTSGH